ncbi:centrosomal protein of 290 kDa-like isoform X4 [Carcharodon carcharias]|uniref:centrosomal protein of 290 kDa-like isoform X4 n=1 Tax=Carcharodon carcharias TaxID=13397 RepID=UPI001B7E8DC6|nr:centrosomal protein of 290 kDa-like isoform X4 [Carcharodon carcharias]
MDIPPIHRCLQLCAENEHVQRKLKKLRLKNEQLESELSDIHGKLRMQQLMRDFVTTRDRLLQMYSALQKRFEKEIKTTKEQNETISKLTASIHELELQLVTSKQRIQQLEHEHTPTRRRRRNLTSNLGSASHKPRPAGRKGCSPDCIHIELLFEIERLQKEKDKLTKERRSLKNELAGLDKGFFEEIEDLKYALQESAKLNKEYEKCLRKICEKYGLPFPQALRPVAEK